MGRPLSEVLAPGCQYANKDFALGRWKDERMKKRKRGNHEGGGGAGEARDSISMEDREEEINLLLQLGHDQLDRDELYQELYHHLVHFSVLDFTNKQALNMLTLGMALQVGPLPNLEFLDLGMQVESENEMEALANAIGMGRLPNLRFLNVSEILFNDCNQVAIKAIARALGMGFNSSSLEQLHLVENAICDEGIKALALVIAGGHLASLRHLNLLYNRISPEGAKLLAVALESGNVPHLVELELSRNCIGDEGAEAISKALASGKLRCLDTLGLWMNDIDVKGATALARALESGNLPALTDIGILDFDDEGTLAIVRSFASGQVRALETVHFEHIDKHTAIELAMNVLEPGHLPNLEELRLTYTSDTQTVRAFIFAYRNNPRLTADLQLDWDSTPDGQNLEDEFNRVRDSNLTIHRILTDQ